MTTVTRILSDEITSSPGRSRRRPASLNNIFSSPGPKVRGKQVTPLDDISEDEGYYTHKTLSTPKKKNKPKIISEDCSESPPKQSKSQHSSESPSALIEKLCVRSGRSGRVKQKSLFKAEDNICTENAEEDGPIKDTKTVFLNARKALHGAVPTELPGREVELENLRKFIQRHLKKNSSGSLYISGPPGTGKTASLNVILQEKHILDQLHQVYVNCTSLKSPTAVFSRIADELGIKSSKSKKGDLSNIETYLKKRQKVTLLLILDEIDQLESKDHSTLYTIFEWPSKHDRIILIGVANSLDLTDRILPRLQARCELKPMLMHFAPYTKSQICEIMTSRLRSADVSEAFSPTAIQILAGKVSAVSGDIRRALDIGRRVIELAEQNYCGSRNATYLRSIENVIADDAVEIDQDSTAWTKKEIKSVELKEVVSVMDNIYGTSQNLADEGGECTFPLQQKLILCSLIVILKKAKNKDVTVGRLYEVYGKICVKQHITAVDQSEFSELCSLIETRGIVRVIGKKEMKLRKINLEWDEEEVFTAMKDKQLMSMVLYDMGCLGL